MRLDTQCDLLGGAFYAPADKMTRRHNTRIMLNVASLIARFPFLRSRLDEHMIEVVSGSLAALLMKVLAAGLGLTFNIILVRMLPVSSVGLYYLALTVNAIGVVVGKMGLDGTLVRFVASNSEKMDWAAVKGVYGKAFKLAIATSLSVTALTALAAPWLAELVFKEPELTGLIRWMSLAVLPVTLFTLYSAVLRGVKRIRDSMFVLSVALPLFSIAGIALLAPVWGVKGVIWAFIAASVITMFIGMFLWRRALPEIGSVKGVFETRSLLDSCTPLLFMDLSASAVTWSTIFLLDIWSSSSDVGIYGIAFRTAALTNFVLVAVNSISAPKFAAFYERKDMKALAATARHSAWIMTIAAAPVLAVFLIVPRWIMGSVYGPQFSEGAAVLAILAIGQFVNVVTGSVGYLLVMTGHERHYRNIVAACAAMHILLSVFLIPRYGITGAAVATAITMSMINLTAALIVQLKLGITTIPGLKIR